MKRAAVVVFVGIIVVAFLMVFGSPAMAKVTGPCADCHTMHYSQNGVSTGYPSGGPFRALTIGDCVGCHSGDSARRGDNNEIPVVLRTTAPTGTGPGKSLAGGDFYWVDAGNPTKGHDVINLPNITGKDANMPNLNPPGWDPAATSGFTFGQVAGGETNWSSQLTCAGKYGCHGRHDVDDDYAAIRGAHHADDSCLKPGSVDEGKQGADVGTSYRFLAGIHGIEDDDWEWTATDGTTDHNEYKGVNVNSSYSKKTTISYLCAECHGQFHSDIGGTSSPWLRHPTDIYLPSDTSKEYYKYNGGTGSANPYSVVAPVGRDKLPANGNPDATITPGSDGSVVLCISCHRAHGSEYDDLLRWDYSTMIAGQSPSPNEGCFICHTTK